MTGAELIAAERERQIEVEGWTPEHDDEHSDGELCDAASCYYPCGLNPSYVIRVLEGTSEPRWPWDWRWFKPFDNEHRGYFPVVDRVRCLVKAGALAFAEEDRLERQGLTGRQSSVRDFRLMIAAEIDRLQRAKETPKA